MINKKKCFLVVVETINGKDDATSSRTPNQLIECQNSKVYAHGETMAEVEMFFKKDFIKSITVLGPSISYRDTDKGHE